MAQQHAKNRYSFIRNNMASNVEYYEKLKQLQEKQHNR